ncbi:MAG: hypothetical protein C3F06_08320 [Candidatus Methanoperedenaceae archaeon]|nr:MAG: hypothetical protein C3F06_08320 [Candidatus Methanoperedenaceae archaeon]
MKINTKVIPFRRIHEEMGNSPQSQYLNRYLTSLNAKTIIVEYNYIDKDYLLDYSYFYSRSFESHERFTTRLHFFSEVFSKRRFKRIFDLDEETQNLLKNSYLGFVVVKPIKQRNEPFIGRTALKTYSKHDGGEHRYYLTNSYPVSLFGFPLTIESLPYQTQDNMVAKCATTAIWVSLYALNALFETQIQSPFEITRTSVLFPGIDRNFPSSGLNIFQMKDYFNSIGMDAEFINVENTPLPIQKHIVSDAVKAYLSLGLPVIACIQLRKNHRTPELHAVVISGYRYDNECNLKELYIHDDQIGIYSKVLSRDNNGDFSHWVNEWVSEKGFEDIFVEKLLIPIYSKIRLSFNSLYKDLLDLKKEGYKAELFLKEIKSYKNYLISKSFPDKYKILTKPFPRFLWVVRIGNRDSPEYDILYDAISLYNEPFQVIMFD